MDSTEDRPPRSGEQRGGEPRDGAGAEASKAAPRPAQGILRRSFLGISAFLAVLAVLAGRLFYVQAIDPVGRAEQALERRRRTQVEPALRGEIHDAGGAVLARSIQRYKITVDQSAVTSFSRIRGDAIEEVSPEELVYQLADLLDLPDREVMESLDGDSRYAVVAEDVTPDVYNAVMDLGAEFLYGEAVSKRSYPDGSVGGSVVGFLNSEGAAGGIEQQFDADLAGEDGERSYEISADGIRIPVGEDVNRPARNGKTVRLTIDRDIQYFAQQQVRARAEELDAEWGTAVVMRVSDGAVLALADSSTIDPNDFSDADGGDFSPRAVTHLTEPGSTEKVLTAAAVIDSGHSEPTTEFDVPAQLRIDGELITDSFEHGDERRTLAGIIADSMNTGTVLAGKQLSRQERYDWFRKFGVGSPTGIELPGEGQGLFAEPDSWDVRQQYTILFGQGVSQTPLQTVMAYQAIANDGVKLTPKIVDSITDADGEEEDRPAPEGSRVVSSDTARKMREIMEVVVTEGGAKEAAVPGWRVGGKTGTAEAPADDGSGFDGYTTSFVGMAPIDDPEYLVAVVMHRPQGEVTAIGTTVAFSRIMRAVLQHYRVPRSTTDPVEIPKFADGHGDGDRDGGQ
ncbi:penicillin-binding protein 2 [Rothia sp. AR01]|uniref:Penicillin-binding protein 2 n=1 Tax=Rothia santali TaxID=2949643 RepID=A0A9X2HKA1_9MICC|nr:penicillin-binding protein 2 [Rothia santali]MCP3426468.1 penicillin-binding protein 2 [Rothia santali]